MDPIDKKLRRAESLFLENVTDEGDAELSTLLPSLIEAGYVEERSWGDDPDWFLWSFTEAGRRRCRALEDLHGDPTDP